MYKLLVFTECLPGVYDGKIICYHGKKKLLLSADRVLFIGKIIGRCRYSYVAVYSTREEFFDKYLYDGSCGYSFREVEGLKEVIWRCESCGYTVRGTELKAGAKLFEEMARYNNGYAQCPFCGEYSLVRVYLGDAWTPRLTAEDVRRMVGSGDILVKGRASYTGEKREMGPGELRAFAEKTVRERFGKDRAVELAGCEKTGVLTENSDAVEGVRYRYGIIYGFGCGEEPVRLCRGFVFESAGNKVYLCTDYLDRAGFLRLVREARIPRKYMGEMARIAREYGVYDDFVKIMAERLYGTKTYAMFEYAYRTGKVEEVADYLEKVLESSPYITDVLRVWFGDRFARQIRAKAVMGKLISRIREGEEKKEGLTRKHYGMVVKELVEKIPDGYDVLYINTRFGQARLGRKSRYSEGCYVVSFSTTFRIDSDRLARVGLDGEYIVRRDGIVQPVSSVRGRGRYAVVCVE